MNASRSMYPLLLIGLAMAGPTAYAASIGAGGHAVMFNPNVYINNPDGRAFEVRVRRFFPYFAPDFIESDAEAPGIEVTVIGPNGNEAARGAFAQTTADARVTVPAGDPGVYRVSHRGMAGYSLPWYETSLPRMVVECAGWNDTWPMARPFKLHVVAPRRWYFYVPRHVRRFDIQVMVPTSASVREDFGLLAMNPRGQRVEAFFGGRPARDSDESKRHGVFHVTRSIEVDEGAAGRFWSIWAYNGDSHSFSDLIISLRGVPPYLAHSPEQWFDPRTGAGPDALVYDLAHVRMRNTVDEQGRQTSRDHYFQAPSPFLGDEGYTGMLGSANLYLLNPENRAIRFGLSTYLIPAAVRLPFACRIEAPDGRIVVNETGVYGHRAAALMDIPPSGGGVYRATVDASKWFAFTEPSVPMVLAGAPIEGVGGGRFNLQIGIARHWFFFVPTGTERFTLRVAVGDPRQRLLAEVHAPDRLAEILYVRGGNPREATIETPPELTGKTWFLRLDVGSDSLFTSESLDDLRHLRVDTTLDLAGVPPYLAPTREQWFDPRDPPPPAPAPLPIDYAVIAPGPAAMPATVPFPDTIETRVYRTVGNRGLRLFFTRPAMRSAVPPACVVLIHGGGWASGVPEYFGHYARYFAKRGAVTASVEYRLVSGEAPPLPDGQSETTIFDSISDVRAAVRWLRAHSAELGIDPERIVAIGDSSGGHLAAAGMLPPMPHEEPDSEISAMPDAMVLLNANLDLGALDWLEAGLPGIPRESVSETEFQRLVRAGSPSAHVRADLPPSLLIHGTKDRTTPLDISRKFALAMCGAGNRSDLVVLDGVAHAFALANYTASPETVVAVIDSVDQWLRALGFLSDPPNIRVVYRME